MTSWANTSDRWFVGYSWLSRVTCVKVCRPFWTQAPSLVVTHKQTHKQTHTHTHDSCSEQTLGKGQPGVIFHGLASLTLRVVPLLIHHGCEHMTATVCSTASSGSHWDLMLMPKVISPLGTKPQQMQPPCKHDSFYLWLLSTEALALSLRAEKGIRPSETPSLIIKRRCLPWAIVQEVEQFHFCTS